MNEREYHDQHYEAEAARVLGTPVFERVHDRVARQFLRATRAGKAHRVLSLGCGDGAIERRFAPYVGEIVGIDVSAVGIRRAQEQCAIAGLGNISFHVGDAAQLAKQAFGRFDIVAAFAFLHHLPDHAIAETLTAARDNLRPGGVFYSADPNRRRAIGLFAGCVRKTYERYHSPDERELDPGLLAALALRSGFAAAEIGYVDFFLGPVAWLAPGTPRALAPALVAADNLLLGVPLVRNFASSFSLLARSPS
ncbi:MAG TPA: methyltransferase domain-containing protein [Burkholderiales bacterium]|nr:methyltransferase domain-containing protein [Burkholderiales bacterium]